jgi:hypothetical protein
MRSSLANRLLLVGLCAGLGVLSTSCGLSQTGPRTIRHITVSIQSGSNVIAIGASTQTKAVAFFSDDTEEDITSRAQWSATGGFVTVSSTGLVTGVAVGSTTVRAAHEGRSGQISFQVR